MSTKGGCAGGCSGGTRRGKKRGLKGGAVFAGFDGTIGTAGAIYTGASQATPYNSATGAAMPDIYGGGARKMTVKAMKKMLKKAGLKTTGKRAALTRRLKTIRKGMKGGSAENATAGAIPAKAAVAGYVGTGSGGLADYVNVSGGVPNQVVPA